MSDMWNNPLMPVEERLDIADGAVRFERKVSTHQREQKEQLIIKSAAQAQEIDELKAKLRYWVTMYYEDTGADDGKAEEVLDEMLGVR